MTRVIRYVGCAGSGKTSNLLKIIKESKDSENISIDDILFISFTKSQISDVKGRISDIFPMASDDDIKNNVKTIHSAALQVFMSSNPNSGIKVITESKTNQEYYEGFCNSNGLEYEFKYQVDEGITDPNYNSSLKSGNVFFKVNSYLETCALDVSLWPDVVKQMKFIDSQCKKFTDDLFTAWKAYKLIKGCYEHDDYINEVYNKRLLPRSRKFLVLDEGQDVSYAQYRLYEMWRDANIFETVILALDDNQSIYKFRGADPKLMIDTRVDDDVGATSERRVKSWRNPSRIHTMGDLMLGKPSHGSPREDGGSIAIETPKDAAEVAEVILKLHRRYGKVMILSRIKAGANQIHMALNYAGIPHTSLTNRYNTWTIAYIMKNNRKVKFDMLQFMKAAYMNPNKAITDLYGMRFSYSDEFLHKIIFKAIKSERRIDPNSIIVDTIHASKGLESPCVVIYDPGFNADGDIAEEHRIYYVAATRSSNHLTLMLGYKAKKFCNIIGSALLG